MPIIPVTTGVANRWGGRHSRKALSCFLGSGRFCGEGIVERDMSNRLHTEGSPVAKPKLMMLQPAQVSLPPLYPASHNCGYLSESTRAKVHNAMRELATGPTICPQPAGSALTDGRIHLPSLPKPFGRWCTVCIPGRSRLPGHSLQQR